MIDRAATNRLHQKPDGPAARTEQKIEKIKQEAERKTSIRLNLPPLESARDDGHGVRGGSGVPREVLEKSAGRPSSACALARLGSSYPRSPGSLARCGPRAGSVRVRLSCVAPALEASVTANFRRRLRLFQLSASQFKA